MEDAASSMKLEKQAIDLTNDEDDVQFFTPSMKQRLEQISASTEDNLADLGTPCSCKRVLSFEDVTRPNVAVKIDHVDDDVPIQSTMQASSSRESPVKKTKGNAGHN